MDLTKILKNLCVVKKVVLPVFWLSLLLSNGKCGSERNDGYLQNNLMTIGEKLIDQLSCSRSIFFIDFDDDQNYTYNIRRIYFTTSTINIQTYKNILQNKTRIENVLQGAKCIILFNNFNNNNNILKFISHQTHLLLPYIWISFTDNITNLPNILYNSQVYIIYQQISHIYLITVYAINDTSNNKVLKLGYWNKSENKFIIHQRIPNYNKPLDNTTLKYASIKISTFLNVTSTNENKKFVGFYSEFTQELCKMLNASYEIIMAEDNQFGAKNPNGQWTGMVGLIQKQLVDITPISTPLLSRFEMVDFGPTVFPNYFKLLFRVSFEKAMDYRFFFQSFEYKVWFLLYAVVIMQQILMNLSEKTSIIQIKMETTWPIVIQEAISDPVKQTATKIVLFTYLIFSILMFIHYSSSITAYLSYSVYKNPFSSLEELLDNHYIPIVLQGGLFEAVFALSKEGDVFKRAWNVMKQHKAISLVKNEKDGVEQIYKHKAGFLTSIRDSYPYIKNNCSFKFAPELTHYFYSCIAYKKNFPFKKQFNIAILRMTEVSFLQRINNKFNLPIWQPCSFDNIFKPVNIYQVIGPMLLFCIGFITSVLIFCIEYCYSRVK